MMRAALAAFFLFPCLPMGCTTAPQQPAEASSPARKHVADDRPVTRSFRVARLADADFASRLLDKLRQNLTPNLGQIDYFEQAHVIIIKDTRAVIRTAETLIQEMTGEVGQVFLDVKIVRTSNPAIVATGVQAEGRPMQGDLAVLGGSEVNAALRLLKEDARTTIVQAPKLIVLDRQKANIRIGRDSRSAGTRPGQPPRDAGHKTTRPWFDLDVTPSILAGGGKVILETSLQSALLPNQDAAITRNILLAASGTAVMRHVRSRKEAMLIFVTANIVRPPATPATRPASGNSD